MRKVIITLFVLILAQTISVGQSVQEYPYRGMNKIVSGSSNVLGNAQIFQTSKFLLNNSNITDSVRAGLRVRLETPGLTILPGKYIKSASLNVKVFCYAKDVLLSTTRSMAINISNDESAADASEPESAVACSWAITDIQTAFGTGIIPYVQIQFGIESLVYTLSDGSSVTYSGASPSAASISSLQTAGIGDLLQFSPYTSVNYISNADYPATSEKLIYRNELAEFTLFRTSATVANGAVMSNKTEFEWIFVPSKSTIDATANTDVASFFQNSVLRPIRVQAIGNSIRIVPVYEDGRFYIRARTLGTSRYDASPQWVYCSSPSGKPYFSNSELISQKSVDQARNWNCEVSYTSNGVAHSILTYADAAFKSRQTSGTTASEKQTISSEVKYDITGQAALTTLPWITNGYDYSYQAGQTNTTTASLNDNILRDKSAGELPALDATKGAARYYSSNNDFLANDPKQGLVPDAAGFVYALSRRSHDARGRVTEEYSPGNVKDGKMRARMHFYETNDNATLTSLFSEGPETSATDYANKNILGNLDYYHKHIVFDENKQSTVQYIDENGRIVASGLRGLTPDNLLPLEGVSTATESISTYPIQSDFSDGRKEDIQTASIANTGIDRISQKFDYTLSAPKTGANTPSYDLRISVTDQKSGNLLVLKSVSVTNQLTRIPESVTTLYEYTNNGDPNSISAIILKNVQSAKISFTVDVEPLQAININKKASINEDWITRTKTTDIATALAIAQGTTVSNTEQSLIDLQKHCNPLTEQEIKNKIPPMGEMILQDCGATLKLLKDDVRYFGDPNKDGFYFSQSVPGNVSTNPNAIRFWETVYNNKKSALETYFPASQRPISDASDLKTKLSNLLKLSPDKREEIYDILVQCHPEYCHVQFCSNKNEVRQFVIDMYNNFDDYNGTSDNYYKYPFNKTRYTNPSGNDQINDNHKSTLLDGEYYGLKQIIINKTNDYKAIDKNNISNKISAGKNIWEITEEATKINYNTKQRAQFFTSLYDGIIGQAFEDIKASQCPYISIDSRDIDNRVIKVHFVNLIPSTATILGEQEKVGNNIVSSCETAATTAVKSFIYQLTNAYGYDPYINTSLKEDITNFEARLTSIAVGTLCQDGNNMYPQISKQLVVDEAKTPQSVIFFNKLKQLPVQPECTETSCIACSVYVDDIVRDIAQQNGIVNLSDSRITTIKTNLLNTCITNSKPDFDKYPLAALTPDDVDNETSRQLGADYKSIYYTQKVNVQLGINGNTEENPTIINGSCLDASYTSCKPTGMNDMALWFFSTIFQKIKDARNYTGFNNYYYPCYSFLSTDLYMPSGVIAPNWKDTWTSFASKYKYVILMFDRNDGCDYENTFSLFFTDTKPNSGDDIRNGWLSGRYFYLFTKSKDVTINPFTISSIERSLSTSECERNTTFTITFDEKYLFYGNSDNIDYTNTECPGGCYNNTYIESLEVPNSKMIFGLFCDYNGNTKVHETFKNNYQTTNGRSYGFNFSDLDNANEMGITSCSTPTNINYSLFKWKDLQSTAPACSTKTTIKFRKNSIPINTYTQQEQAICLNNAMKQALMYKQTDVINGALNSFNTKVDTYFSQAKQPLVETLKTTKSASNAEYFFTLYYYDRAGNLVQTVPPKGATPNAAKSFKTTYSYNSRNLPTQKSTPDAGSTEYQYNAAGQLAVSLTDEQKARKYFTAYDYDNLGRSEGSRETDDRYSDYSSFWSLFLASNTNISTMVSRTVNGVIFSYGSQSETLHDSKGNPFILNNIANRIYLTSYRENSVYQTCSNDQETKYGYDPQGNVNVVYQYNAFIDKDLGRPTDAVKVTTYKYDALSGNVLEVNYQKGCADQLIHRYRYDADGRLVLVQTSRNGLLWTSDAGYQYYRHGTLARTTLGIDQNPLVVSDGKGSVTRSLRPLQGLDYAYTVQGMIKAVNSPALDPSLDPGADGLAGSTNAAVLPDMMGYSLHYNPTDYKSISGKAWMDWDKTANNPIINSFTQSTVASAPMPKDMGLYNGNISAMTTGSYWADPSAPTTSLKLQNTALYGYDLAQRLRSTYNSKNTVAAAQQSPTASVAAPITGAFRNSYDFNGNITNLDRYTKNSSNTLEAFDQLNYMYAPVYNKLFAVGDGGTLNINNDNFNIKGESYAYDASGRITNRTYYTAAAPNQCSQTFSWTPQNKLSTVSTTTYSGVQNLSTGEITFVPSTTNTKFYYDAAGNRVMNKTTIGGVDTYTYYAYDANGVQMANYEYNSATPSAGFALKEHILYGAGRLGSLAASANRHARRAGARHYELTNHLGNVLAVIGDRIDRSTNRPILEQAQAYEPFGQTLANTSFNRNAKDKYRFGFNGKENIEVGSSWQDFGARLYDRRLGRWMSCDPLQDKYPSLTPYNFVANSPTMLVDPDGRKFVAINAFSLQFTMNWINYTFNGNSNAINLFQTNGLTFRKITNDQLARVDKSKLNNDQNLLLDAFVKIINDDKTLYFGAIPTSNRTPQYGCTNSILLQNGYAKENNETFDVDQTINQGSHVIGYDNTHMFAFVDFINNASVIHEPTKIETDIFDPYIIFVHEVFGEAYNRFKEDQLSLSNYSDKRFGKVYFRIQPVQWENVYLRAVKSQLISTGRNHVSFENNLLDNDPFYIVTPENVNNKDEARPRAVKCPGE